MARCHASKVLVHDVIHLSQTRNVVLDLTVSVVGTSAVAEAHRTASDTQTIQCYGYRWRAVPRKSRPPRRREYLMAASAWTASLSDRSVQKIRNSSAFRCHFRSTAGPPRE